MGTVLIVLFGVLLPAATLVIELSTGMCAEAFFNPLATIGHVALVAFVPLANLVTLIGLHKQPWRKWLLWINGIAIGIAAVYTLVFVPLMPVAVIAILAFGMGLLPLAPFFAFVCALILMVRLAGRVSTDQIAGQAPATTHGRLWASIIGSITLGCLLVALAEAPVSLTLIGTEMAASELPDQRARGLEMLRRVGNRDELLRMCYRDDVRGEIWLSRSGSRSISGFLFAGLPRGESQKLFYRVTGQPFNSLPPPRGVRRLGLDEFDFDSDLGGQVVAGRRRGLALVDSRIDGQIEADGGLAYMEWTLNFRNNHPQQREARAQIALPPGGVVSRVSLWVNGEPREAAFAGTSQVRAAYRKVAIEQRRDPLLVTWSGSDQVMIQCFPIPSHGEMKVRLGITAPLYLASSTEANLRLPCLAERNFGIAATVGHAVWLEADQPCRTTLKQVSASKEGKAKHVLRGTLTDEQLLSGEGVIAVSRSAKITECCVADPKDPEKYIVQKLKTDPTVPKRHLSVVIDGSVPMQGQFDTIAKLLAHIPAETKLTVLVAGDEVVDVSNSIADREENGRGLAERLHGAASSGGCDNVPALLHALEKATDPSGATILWIHASQPVLLQSAAALAQWLERDSKVVLYDLPTVAGPNQILAELRSARGIQAVPRFGSVGDDLQRFLAQSCGKANVNRWERSRVDIAPPETLKVSNHLAQLWAADQVAATVRSNATGDRAEAVKLAGRYHIVSPVSGAVVLETEQQYKDAKLKPEDSSDSQATADSPEPGTLILLATAAIALYLWSRLRGKHSAGAR